jgi:protein-S-isoprenylcysteine O-methyltransferase Ste14
VSPWIAKGIVLLASVALVAIRAPHGHRSRHVPVAKSHKGPLEIALLTVAWIAFLLPLLWVVTPLLSFADYALRAVPLNAGVVALVWGLWLFHRTHEELGTHWSITLEVRERHRLVAEGPYRRVRHPMYLALLIYAAGMALVLPNWIAGPAYLVAMLLLFALRVGPEERMMLEAFGGEYEAYRSRTKRLVPWFW